jgi:kynurenine formamidase
MPVHNDMVTFPRVVRPAITLYETWEEFAERIGAAKYGATELTASSLVVLGDHVGTHIDSLRHVRKTGSGPEGIPLELCYADGVVLDFTRKEKGAGISKADVQHALGDIQYHVKPMDIVLIHTGAGAYQDEERYLTDHCGMSGEATKWLIDRGVQIMGIKWVGTTAAPVRAVAFVED